MTNDKTTNDHGKYQLPRHVARIWPRKGRRNPGASNFSRGFLSKEASSIERGKSSELQRVSSFGASTEGLLDLLRSQMSPSGQTQTLAVIHRLGPRK